MKASHHGKNSMIICFGDEGPRGSYPSALGGGPCGDGNSWKVRGKGILF